MYTKNFFAVGPLVLSLKTGGLNFAYTKISNSLDSCAACDIMVQPGLICCGNMISAQEICVFRYCHPARPTALAGWFF
jgi:hypothetical protein